MRRAALDDLAKPSGVLAEFKALSLLVPYAHNARTHTPRQVDQIKALMVEHGWTNPVLADDVGIIAGHGRVLAAAALYAEGRRIKLPGGDLLPEGTVPVIDCTGWTETQRRAYILADNQSALNAGWDTATLKSELGMLEDAGFELELLGFAPRELRDLLADDDEDSPDLDSAPATPKRPVTRLGDVWVLGRHRVMCGDSTVPGDVALLMAGQTAGLMHADPPYGMGKEADGVVNDNLYRAKLDAFQLRWWQAFRPWLASNASAFVWGNAPDLWRLWYVAGLGETERFELRNEIVWDKKSIAGMASPDLTQFPEASERCLFFQFGQQFIGNVNVEDFPEAWEPLRAYFEAEAKAAGIVPADIQRVCGCGMFSHWFTRAQYTLMPERHHATLAAAYPGRFTRPWATLKAEWDRVKGSARARLHNKVEGTRSYFDNAHDVMRDVWEFPRVSGDERHGHATPKPVAMMQRALLSALPLDGLCVEPFGGSGSTLIAAESVDRRCYTMELQPEFCDVIVQRWQALTLQEATLEASGSTFDNIAAERRTTVHA